MCTMLNTIMQSVSLIPLGINRTNASSISLTTGPNGMATCNLIYTMLYNINTRAGKGAETETETRTEGWGREDDNYLLLLL